MKMVWKISLMTFAFGLYFIVSGIDAEVLRQEEIEELRRRLKVVRDETMREARKIVEDRKQEAMAVGEEFAKCVTDATKELEEGVVQELESRIGVLDEELRSGKSLEREELRRKVETATVGAEVAVEKRTTAFIMKVFSCSRKQFEH